MTPAQYEFLCRQQQAAVARVNSLTGAAKEAAKAELLAMAPIPNPNFDVEFCALALAGDKAAMAFLHIS